MQLQYRGIGLVRSRAAWPVLALEWGKSVVVFHWLPPRKERVHPRMDCASHTRYTSTTLPRSTFVKDNTELKLLLFFV